MYEACQHQHRVVFSPPGHAHAQSPDVSFVVERARRLLKARRLVVSAVAVPVTAAVAVVAAAVAPVATDVASVAAVVPIHAVIPEKAEAYQPLCPLQSSCPSS